MSRPSPKLRHRILQEARFQCEYCRSPQVLLMADLEIDHILSKVKGEKSIFDNVCAACRKCNEFKGTQTEAVDPETKKRVSL